MIFERPLIGILFLSTLLNDRTRGASSTNGSEFAKVKCDGDTWPSNTSCRLTGDNLPYCYCDDICHEYKDCCEDINSVNGIEGHVPDNRPDVQLRARACVKINDDFLGFRVVNSCGREDNFCYDNTGSAKVVLDPPVTDSNNVTYSNAHCARCNNVTTFRTWDVLIFETTYSSMHIQSDTTFTESVFEDRIANMLPVIGTFKLIPPSDVKLRVCYGKTEEYENCSPFQRPFVNNWGNEVFKDEECCLRGTSDGKCILAWDVNQWCNTFRNIQEYNGNLSREFLSVAANSYNSSPINALFTGTTKGFAILLQFSKYERADSWDPDCTAGNEEVSKNDRCRLLHDSLRRNILVSKYPVERYKLILESHEPYHLEIIAVIIRSLATFLFETKWRISFHSYVPLDITIMEGYQCASPNGKCTFLILISKMFPGMALTVSDTVVLDSWMKEIKLDIFIKSQTSLFHVFGSYSTDPAFNYTCSCNNRRFVQEMYTYAEQIKHLPIASSSIPNDCIYFEISVTYNQEREDLKITCKEDDKENNGVNHNGHLLLIHFFIIFWIMRPE